MTPPAFLATPSAFPSDLGSERLGPGRYVVWRRLVIGGDLHGRRIECANPAYAIKVIGEWEKALRDQAKAKAEAQV